MKLLNDEKQQWLREFLEKLEPNLYGEDKAETQKWINELRVKRVRRRNKPQIDAPEVHLENA